VKILVLGGTAFLGRHLTEIALAREYDVVHFNRGRTSPSLFPEVETVVGDRESDLERLAGRSFDAVVDTSGYEPATVAASVRQLGAAAEHYTFISSVSVYADVSSPGVDETASLAIVPAGEDASATRETHYGALKALCEQEVEKAFPGQSLVIRPGLIVGPHDPTGRFGYWPHRIARGGQVVAPVPRDRPTQIVDARDLAAWIVACIELRQVGVFNAVGPVSQLAFGSLLEVCREVAGSDATVTWVDEQFLLDQGVEPWSELPLWIPSSWPDEAGFDQIDGSRAFAAGLVLRPLEETVAATLAETEWAIGSSLTPEREIELLNAWHTREV
jgi:2'-hydroxyisoflavone reductase